MLSLDLPKLLIILLKESFIKATSSFMDQSNNDDEKFLSEKEKLELEKLRNETKLSKRELRSYYGTQILEAFKVISPIITIVILYLTFTSNQKQHTEDVYAKDIQQLASSVNSVSKIVALAKLSTYF